MVEIDEQTTVDADPGVRYRTGSVLNVNWEMTDGSSQSFIGMVVEVSDRKEPRRKRSELSHYKYKIAFQDGTRPLWTRLLHREHSALYVPQAHPQKKRRFVHCGALRYELPGGIKYNSGTKKCTPSLGAKKIGNTRRCAGYVRFTLKQYPDVRTPLYKAINKRVEMILEYQREAKKAGIPGANRARKAEAGCY